MSMKAVKIIDAICIVIFVLMGVYIFVLPNATQDLLLPVFTIINPYKTGAWIMGIGFLRGSWESDFLSPVYGEKEGQAWF